MFRFIELTSFSRYRKDYFTDEQFAEFQSFLNQKPTSGDLIPGSGGMRKIRWTRAGSGKRGGLRVIYFYQDHRGIIWLLTVYSKSAKENISVKTLKALREVIDNAEVI